MLTPLQMLDASADTMRKSWEAFDAARRAFVIVGMLSSEWPRAASLSGMMGRQMAKDIAAHDKWFCEMMADFVEGDQI